ncbi:HK97 gp10 family phage protein [Nonomuraea endophytica]|uniref:HK97 gp10 family phage protein n=1 Tax=Nonomuraea endophytica TaxID=714136 RepID=UPI0037C6F981
MAGRSRNNTDDLRRLIRDVGKLPDEVRKELRPALRTVGRKAQDLARVNAAWSTRIPQAIRLSVSFAKRRPGVSVFVDRRRAEHGRALENLGRPGFFRHPVPNTGARGRLGRLAPNARIWVRQPARPFLFPAAESVREEMDTEIGRAVDAAARTLGFV